ncbi:MAG: phosphatase PAP2 family protein [Erysipelothrix sp.]|nr:phosphatase PAP2 family protein [Erysipelothrix sp.]
MRKYINRNSIIVLLFASLLFVALTSSYNSIFIKTIDQNVLSWMIEHTEISLVYVFKFLTLLASWQCIILISIALLVFGRDKLKMLLIPSITLISVLSNETIKNVIVRPRPNVLALTQASGYSMPSGHSLTAMVFYGLIMILVVANMKDRRYRNLTRVLLSMLIILIGVSRMYLRVHYLSDVVTGFMLGLMIISVIYNVKVGVFDNITSYLEESNE